MCAILAIMFLTFPTQYIPVNAHDVSTHKLRGIAIGYLKEKCDSCVTCMLLYRCRPDIIPLE